MERELPGYEGPSLEGSLSRAWCSVEGGRGRSRGRPSVSSECEEPRPCCGCSPRTQPWTDGSGSGRTFPCSSGQLREANQRGEVDWKYSIRICPWVVVEEAQCLEQEGSAGLQPCACSPPAELARVPQDQAYP